VIDRCLRCGGHDQAWRESLAPQLAEHGIRIVRYSDLESEARERLTSYFERAIFPVLTPLVVDPAHPFPFISSGSLSLALNVRHPVSGQDRFARVKVPGNRPRFVDAGDYRFVLIEDLITAHLTMLFPGMEVTEAYALRVIRSAEVGSPGEEADDLLEFIESTLRKRRLAEAVSLEVTGTFTEGRLELLLEELQLSERDVYQSQGPLGLHDLFQLADLPSRPLQSTFHAAVPTVSRAWRLARFSHPSRADILVHHPTIVRCNGVRFIEEAAEDPAVLHRRRCMDLPDSPISNRSSMPPVVGSRSRCSWSSRLASTKPTTSNGRGSWKVPACTWPMVCRT